MSSTEIEIKFREKKRIVWRQMIAQQDKKSMKEIEEMFDLFLDYGVQKLFEGLEKGKEIYSCKKQTTC